jgi:hypothetical protein
MLGLGIMSSPKLEVYFYSKTEPEVPTVGCKIYG